MQQDTRNMVVFVIAAIALMFVYQSLVLGPAAKRREAEAKAVQVQAAAQAQAPAALQASVTIPRAQALARSQRVQIDTPSLKGSIALTGGRIDDLHLKGYRETLAKTSPLEEQI